MNKVCAKKFKSEAKKIVTNKLGLNWAKLSLKLGLKFEVKPEVKIEVLILIAEEI